MTMFNMDRYGKPHPADSSIRFYLTVEEGRKTAEDCGLKKAVMTAPPVDIVIRDSDDRGYHTSSTRNTVNEAWLKGFFGPTAREVGIPLFMSRVTINGTKLDGTHGGRVVYLVRSYLEAEIKRLEKAAEEADRKAGKTVWTEPGQFLIPDIGTIIQLTEDWTFRLFSEDRNGALLKKIGKPTTYRWDDQMKDYEVTIPVCSQLGVDRVYIRKGAGDFSSITFNLHKGSEIIFNGKALKAFGRFWAKLSDVNRMKVRIDTATLAGN